MISKALALAVVVAVVGVAVGVLGLSIATASEHPERSFSQAPVAPGDEVEVTIIRVGAAGLAPRQVVETLPEGFTFVAGSEMSPDTGSVVRYTQGDTAQEAKFTVLGVTTLKYKVMAGANVAENSYTFTGVVVSDPNDPSMNVDVGGTQSIMVSGTTADPTTDMTPDDASPEPSMVGMRSVPSGAAAPGSQVRVTITGLDLMSGAGRVIETLPAGFSYVDGSAMSPDPQARIRVSESGRMVTFTVLGIDTLHYMVMAGSSVAGGQHNISGVLQLGPDTPGQMIGGQSAITVSGTAPTTGLRRTLSDASVERGDEVTVTILDIDLLTSAGRIVETLPAGLSYVEDSASTPDATGRIRDEASGQVVTFTLLGVDTLTYKVMVDSDATTATRSFSGVLKSGPEDAGQMIGGASRITIGTPVVVRPTEPMPVPTRRRRSRGGGGGGGGGYAPLPVATPTPMPTRVPSIVATIAPTPTPIIVPTIVAPTVAPTPEPTAKPEPTAVAVPPTAVPTPRPTARVVVPTVAPTKPPEPTAMPKPTAAPTAVPPTEVPPTAMVEPTEPPAPTATIAPTVAPVAPVTPTDDGMPTWLIIVIIVIIVAVVIAAIGFYLMRMRR